MEINRIHEILRREYAGESWHGPSLSEILEGVSAQQATKRVFPNVHNIAELVIHMTNWRIFTLEKLTGGDSYDIILNSKADWSTINDLTDEGWQEILETLADTQTELLEITSKFPVQRINHIVPGRKYSFYMLLHGIIQHDIYHAGQISILKKMI